MYAKTYYEQNRDKINERRRESRRLNPERQREWEKASYRKLVSDPVRKAAYDERQRVRHKIMRERAVVVLGGKCVRCGLDDWRALEFDHVTPKRGFVKAHRIRKTYKDISEGTYSGPELQLLCGSCHNIKSYLEDE